MTSSNRTRLSLVRETTPGVTPVTPRMRTVRFTSESLGFIPEFVKSDEINDDRMSPDSIKIMQSGRSGLNGELHFPVDNFAFSEVLRSAMWNPWDNMASWDNDGVADSVITAVTSASNSYSVTSGGTQAVLGHLVRATGFAQPANNQIFRVASSTGATIVGTALGLTAESVPAAAARLKIVGFQGASGDITATATGLGSTALDFTTLNLKVGQWINIGGTAVGDKFATAALNNWARISAIAANALTLDNLPVGWTTDSGTGKTIKVWITDMLKNGTTISSLSLEKGFMAQATPTYVVGKGMAVNTMEFTFARRQKITWAAAFVGMGGGQGTTSLDASPDAASTGAVMAAHANVSRMAEGGSPLTHPNGAQEFSVRINNNIRPIEILDATSPVDIQPGEFNVTGRIGTYFGSNALLQKFYAGDPTSLSARAVKNNQAMIFDIPRCLYVGGGGVDTTGGNTDVALPLEYEASRDPATNAHLIVSRAEYVEIN